MKAEIDGVRLEGTAQEIADYVRLVGEKKAEAKPAFPKVDVGGITVQDLMRRIQEETNRRDGQLPPHTIQTYPSWQPNINTTTYTYQGPPVILWNGEVRRIPNADATATVDYSTFTYRTI